MKEEGSEGLYLFHRKNHTAWTESFGPRVLVSVAEQTRKLVMK